MKELANFWRLYGAGLFKRPAADFEPMSGEQWKRVRYLARRNKLSGLLLDGVSLLPEQVKPPQELLAPWAIEVAQNAHAHWEHNRVIADLAHRWREAGVRPVLLKGQGYARLYPTPTLRMVGDIDVFVCRTEFDRAMEVVHTLKLDNGRLPDTGKHIEFFYRRKAVELHRRSADIFHRPDLDEDYQQWSEAVLPQSTSGFHIDENGHEADNGEWIATPPPTFCAFYTFMHLWGHMYNDSSHVRSFADWILLLRAHKGELDLVELEQRLRQFDLLKQWQIMGCFVVRYMGVDPTDIPFYDPAKMRYHKRYYRFFSNEIGGLLYDGRSSRSLSRRAHNLKYYLHYYRSRLGIYPTKLIIKDFINVIAFGLKGIRVKDPHESHEG